MWSYFVLNVFCASELPHEGLERFCGQRGAWVAFLRSETPKLSWQITYKWFLMISNTLCAFRQGFHVSFPADHWSHPFFLLPLFQWTPGIQIALGEKLVVTLHLALFKLLFKLTFVSQGYNFSYNKRPLTAVSQLLTSFQPIFYL